VNIDEEEGKDVWRLLPDGFTEAYGLLAQRALPVMASRNGDRSGRAKSRGHQDRLTSGGRDYVMAAGAAHVQGVATDDVVGSQAAFSLKMSIDRKLRKLAREMGVWLRTSNTSRRVVRRCSGRCKKYAEPDWTYCPTCGSPTVDVG
jgi:hypothetical protein